MGKFYTVTDIAEMFQVTQVTVRDWARTKKLESYKIGNSYRFDDEQIQDFLRNEKK